MQEALAGVLKKQPPAASGGGGGGGGGNKPAATQQQQGQGQGQSMKNKRKGAPREFDFSRFSTRHIALQLAYEGDRYLGFSTRVRVWDTLGCFLNAQCVCLDGRQGTNFNGLPTRHDTHTHSHTA